MFVRNVQQFADHARALAQAFGVDLIEEDAMKPEGAFAAQLSLPGIHLKGVAIHPIRDETTYAVALHEIGHCLAPLGSLPFEKQRFAPDSVEYANVSIVEEEAAWEWAQHYALEWTQPMQGVQDWALGTYAAGKKQTLALVAERETKRLAAEAWQRRHKIESAGSFMGKIGHNIHID